MLMESVLLFPSFHNMKIEHKRNDPQLVIAFLNNQRAGLNTPEVLYVSGGNICI